MASRFSRAAAAALCSITLSLAAAEPHPEVQLIAALDDLNAGKINEAWQTLDQLVKRQPNFRLAQLFYGEMLAARAGPAARARGALWGPP